MAPFRSRIRLEGLTPIEYGYIVVDIMHSSMFVSRNCTNMSMRIRLIYDHIYSILITIIICTVKKTVLPHGISMQTYQV